MEISRELAAVIVRGAIPGDDSQVLAQEVVDACQQHGLFSMLLPKENGGRSITFPTYVATVFDIAKLDGSTAWCVNQASVLAGLARHLPDNVASDIWPDSSSSVANGPPTPGKCRSTESQDGYVLSGHWTFSSGIAHSKWLLGMAATQKLDGSKSVLWHVFPKSEANIVPDWHVTGLRQTGSFEFSVDELHVPADRVFENTIRGDDEPIYQIPMNLQFAAGFAAVALGVARTAIDAAIIKTRQKIRRFDKNEMMEDPSTHQVIGQCEAQWQAAHSYLEQAVERTWDEVNAKRVCSKKQRYELRLAATHAIRESKNTTDLVYDLCSTDSIRHHEPLNRAFQDIHVISQHLQARPEVYRIVGRYLVGIDEEHILVN